MWVGAVNGVERGLSRKLAPKDEVTIVLRRVAGEMQVRHPIHSPLLWMCGVPCRPTSDVCLCVMCGWVYVWMARRRH